MFSMIYAKPKEQYIHIQYTDDQESSGAPTGDYFLNKNDGKYYKDETAYISYIWINNNNDIISLAIEFAGGWSDEREIGRISDIENYPRPRFSY